MLGALVVSPASAWAQAEPEDLDALRAQLREQQRLIEQQQQRLIALEQKENQSWLDERQAQEVKELVREVLADTETRASLLGNGLTAGYDRGFFIASNDNAFHLQINPEFQVRYIYNTRDGEPAGTDEDESGFQLRRTRLDFRGHAFDPALTYRIRLSADRGSGRIDLDQAWIAYAFGEDWQVKVGQIKPRFVREEDVSALRQLAVERSYAADYFTIDLTQGVELTYDGGWWRPSVAIHSGSYAANTDFNADRTDIALTGRVQFLAAGDWKQFDDFTSWSGDAFGLLLGAAADYEVGETGSGMNMPDIFKYSADVSAEFGGANLFAAIYGQQFSDNGSTAGLPSAIDDAEQLAVVVQGGFFVIPDKLELFGRYEWIDFDGVYYRNSGSGTQSGTGNLASDELSLVTIGGNWYFKKHNSKLTVDIVWALDPVPVANSGAGLLTSTDEDQVALRAQWQLAF